MISTSPCRLGVLAGCEDPINCPRDNCRFDLEWDEECSGCGLILSSSEMTMEGKQFYCRSCHNKLDHVTEISNAPAVA